jgi:hypothetical protein
MGKPKAPKSPDPKETAAAQTATNVTTALANAQLGNVDQYGPDGSVTYSTNGYTTFTDPTSGATYNIPRYVQTTKLSGSQQAIKDQSDAANLNLSQIANKQSAFLEDYLSKPVDLTSANVDKYIDTHFMDDFNRDQDQQLSSLRSRLINSGIQEGSDAWTKAMNNFQSQRANAYDNLYGSQRNNAVSQILAERNQPLNEISGLISGTQVGVPTFGAPTNQPQLPTVDYAGLVQSDYQNKMAAYQAQQQQRQGLLGGLFGLGAAGIMASDRRVKKDIERVGEAEGHKLYSFRYKSENDNAPKHVGVMAQEVAKTRPDAVVRGPDGVLMVKYGTLFGAKKAA